MTAETMKLGGGSIPSNTTSIVNYLASIGITASNSSGILSITTAGLAGANKTAIWEEVLRIVDANGGTFTYTASA